MKNFPLDFRNKWTDRDVEAHWDSVASIYISENEKVKGTHDQRFVESVEQLDLQAGDRLLNISSRDCEANDYILKKDSSVTVVNAEISSGLMEEAKKHRPYVEQVKVDSYSRLPFKDVTFDRILTLETLEHVEQPLQYLMELHRLAKPGARMVISCPPATSEIPYQVFTFLFGGHGEGPHKFPSSRKRKEVAGANRLEAYRPQRHFTDPGRAETPSRLSGRMSFQDFRRRVSQSWASGNFLFVRKIEKIQDVVQQRLCNRCGTCVGLAEGSITFSDRTRKYLPQVDHELDDSLNKELLKYCSGKGFDFPAQSQNIFGKGSRHNIFTGSYKNIYIGNSADESIRRNAASGGILSSILIWLLEKGQDRWGCGAGHVG